MPLDYDDPTAGVVRLALIKSPASGARPAKGSIFLNPGGPGGSGVDFVRGTRDFLFTEQVRRRFDLVGFDPRGIARSRPVECFDTVQEALAVLTPFPFPFTDSEERRWVRSDREYAAACAENAGPIIDHMSTANVARDMDLLRRAVGDERMTFAGYSYGSMIGSTYAAMFPDKVRAVVIDGILDPVAWSTGRGDQAETLPVSARLRSEQGSFETLQQFLTLCDEAGDRCAFSGGDPRRRYQLIARQLIDDPVRLPGQGRITYNVFVIISLGAMYDPSVWPDFARFLNAVRQQSRPDQVAQRLADVRERIDDLPVPGGVPSERFPGIRPIRGWDTSQVIEGFAGVICSDSNNPDSPDDWARAAAAADRRYPYFGRPWVWFSSICAWWPGVDEDRFIGPYSAETTNAVLVVGTRFDPATPYQNAVSTAGVLGRARLLTLDGWGHTSLFSSRCIDDYTAEYLLHRRLPPRGASCRPDRVPFAG
ncbi:MAG: alpha/beta hydrolase [Actinomycetota bacterium]|nr:alpha/beta hydrolase [Actinomycetota bacterium]